MNKTLAKVKLLKFTNDAKLCLFIPALSFESQAQIEYVYMVS